VIASVQVRKCCGLVARLRLHAHPRLTCGHTVHACSRTQTGGDAAAAAQEMAAAEAAFSAAVALDPDDPQAYANLAIALHNSNELSRAVDMWDKTLARINDKRQ
jgi:Flp pilus assembly protein TadD